MIFIVIIIISLIIFIIKLKTFSKRKINIFIGNSFHNYHILPSKLLRCSYNKIIYTCQYSNRKDKKYHTSIFNGNRNFPTVPNTSYNIIMTVEKMSQVKFMKHIGEGKNKYYKLAVDYRLFNNKYHISRPYLSNISYLIYESKKNFVDINTFMKRSNKIVYIQKVYYYNRNYIVHEIMKYYPVDSYGKDMNNRKWPNNISRENKIELLKKYKFCLAIENSVILWKRGDKFVASEINDDYVTEKLFDCFLAGCIPIYFGPKTVNLFLPNNESIINLNNFKSIKNLSFFLNSINNNITPLSKYFKWYYNYSIDWFKNFTNYFNFNYCKICNYVMINAK